MLVYAIRRIIQSVFVLVAMAAIVFLGVFAIGDPVDVLINPEATQAEMDAARERLGLDKPLYEQFFIFVGNAIQGEMGTSFVHGVPAMGLILERLPATLELAFVAMAIAVFVGIPLGVWAGLKPDAASGRGIMAGSIVGFSLPNFWQGILLIMVFAVWLNWLPASGRGDTIDILGIPVSLFTSDGWSHVILPAINLALFKTALVVRLARAGTREVVLQDYVKFARAKGLPYHRVVGVHILKNMMIPVVTILGLEFGSLLAFAVVTETVFAWPGMGKLLIDSILNLDRPVVVAYLMLTVFIFIIINLVVDLLYAALDPRIRLSENKA